MNKKKEIHFVFNNTQKCAHTAGVSLTFDSWSSSVTRRPGGVCVLSHLSSLDYCVCLHYWVSCTHTHTHRFMHGGFMWTLLGFILLQNTAYFKNRPNQSFFVVLLTTRRRSKLNQRFIELKHTQMQRSTARRPCWVLFSPRIIPAHLCAWRKENQTQRYLPRGLFNSVSHTGARRYANQSWTRKRCRELLSPSACTSNQSSSPLTYSVW